MPVDDFIASKDGTTIHVRRIGAGPALVLVHGGLQTAGALSELAKRLSDDFTVYSINRRGRPPSGPVGEHYCLEREVEDLNAVLQETGARDVFGLSSGALITLRAALGNFSIARIALYEPPMEVAGASSPFAWTPDYDEAMAVDNKARALAAILKNLDDPSLMTRMPRFVLELAFRRMMGAKAPGGVLSVAELIPTFRYDIALAREMAGTVDHYRELSAQTLLLGGDKSRSFLAAALDALGDVLPHSSRVRITGAGHTAPANDGAPDRVAVALKRFFAPAALRQ